jgi:hypothetical protein
MFIDNLAQRVSAFGELAATLDSMEDERVKELGLEMLQCIIDSCTILKPQASLSVVR